MTLRPALLLSSAAAALALAGCAGSADDYANLNQQSAEEHALSAVVWLVNEPGSGLYHHHVRLVAATKTRDASGRRVWSVRIADRTVGRMLCVLTRLDVTGIVAQPQVDITTCGQFVPEGPATTSSGAA